MYKKLANYPNWEKVEKKEYKQIHVEDEFFKGYVCILNVLKTNLDFIKKHPKENIIDGFKWLEFYSDENKNTTMMAAINEKDEVLYFYYDITLDVSVTEEGIPYGYDLYLDVVQYIDGRIEIIDEDELAEALDEKVITKEQYDFAYTIKDKILEKITGKENEIKEFVEYNYRKIMEIK